MNYYFLSFLSLLFVFFKSPAMELFVYSFSKWIPRISHFQFNYISDRKLFSNSYCVFNNGPDIWRNKSVLHIYTKHVQWFCTKTRNITKFVYLFPVKARLWPLTSVRYICDHNLALKGFRMIHISNIFYTNCFTSDVSAKNANNLS